MWKPIQLTPSGRPALLQDEIELIVQDQVSVYQGDRKTHRSGFCSLTSHRICWIGEAVAIALHIDSISKIEKVAKIIGFSSPKVIINTKLSTSLFKLSFHQGGRDVFFDILEQAMKSQAWIVNSESSKKKANAATQSLSDLSGNAGISAIMNAKEKEQKDAEQTLGSAFKDLDALMILAKDLVSLADSFSKKVAESEEHSEDEQKINSVMMSLGIISSISKESSETAYINQLARQLADFLLPIVQKEGGLIQITDAYCLFNRAKGTDLISPEDLLRACREMKRLQLPLLLRKLTSGSMVLQAASHSDGKLSKIVLEILKNQGPMTALQLSKAMQVSLVLAKQYLFVAEQLGILCRDETVDSLRFYENLII